LKRQLNNEKTTPFHQLNQDQLDRAKKEVEKRQKEIPHEDQPAEAECHYRAQQRLETGCPHWPELTNVRNHPPDSMPTPLGPPIRLFPGDHYPV
jgi:hypothetical protein